MLTAYSITIMKLWTVVELASNRIESTLSSLDAIRDCCAPSCRSLHKTSDPLAQIPLFCSLNIVYIYIWINICSCGVHRFDLSHFAFLLLLIKLSIFFSKSRKIVKFENLVLIHYSNSIIYMSFTYFVRCIEFGLW